jgi:RNA recognition motif-containing protein
MRAAERIRGVKTIYVGNLAYTATEDDLRTLFAAHGAVTAVRVALDKETGKARGFAFVEMDDADADKAIKALDGADLQGRALRINEAQRRDSRPPR